MMGPLAHVIPYSTPVPRMLPFPSTDSFSSELITISTSALSPPHNSSTRKRKLSEDQIVRRKIRRNPEMARFLVLFAACLLPAIASAISGNSFLLKGKVYCDTCRVGYETTASKYLAGSTVKLVCSKRNQPEAITYTSSGVTGSDGEYKIPVSRDCGDDICDVILEKSSDPECATPNSGRDRARVILTWNNGMASGTRFGNNLGFLQNVPLASCPQILQQYQDTEDSF